MPFESGSYTPSNGFYSGEGLFRQARLANDDIRSDHMDGLVSDLSGALNSCLLRDGSAALAGDLDMGLNRIRNVASATLTTDIVQYGQAVDNGVRRATREVVSTSGNMHTIGISLSPMPTTLTGLFLRAVMPSTQTGSFEIAIQGLDTRHVYNTSGARINLTIAAGEPMLLLYDRSSSRWIWLNSPYEDFVPIPETSYVEQAVSATSDNTWDLDTTPNIIFVNRADGQDHAVGLVINPTGGFSGTLGRALFNITDTNQSGYSWSIATVFSGTADASVTNVNLSDYHGLTCQVIRDTFSPNLSSNPNKKYILGVR